MSLEGVEVKQLNAGAYNMADIKEQTMRSSIVHKQYPQFNECYRQLAEIRFRLRDNISREQEALTNVEGAMEILDELIDAITWDWVSHPAGVRDE